MSTAKNGCATVDAGEWSNACLALRCDCWCADIDCHRCVGCGLDWPCAGRRGEGEGLVAAVRQGGSDDWGAGWGEAAYGDLCAERSEGGAADCTGVHTLRL